MSTLQKGQVQFGKPEQVDGLLHMAASVAHEEPHHEKLYGQLVARFQSQAQGTDLV